MKNIRTAFARFRLFTSFMVLVLMLCALAVTPVRADVCDDVCSGWNSQVGCTSCSHCCVYDDGHYVCTPKSDRNCGTGGPGLIE